MAGSYLLGIDTGTSAAKVGIYDSNGILRGQAYWTYAAEQPHPGWVELDPGLWWAGLPEGIATACAEARISPHEIAAVGLSTLCPALIPFDKDGEPLRRAIIVIDQRSEAEAASVRATVGEEQFFQLAGNMPLPGTCSGMSMLWIKAHEPEIFRRTAFFGHGNTYLGLKLTGRAGIDPSNASYTGLFTTGAEGAWSEELSAFLGVPLSLLPPAVPSFARLGEVTAAAAAYTGLRQGTPVAMGGADTACSALALGAVEDGAVFESSGTSDVITICLDQPRFDSRFLNRRHVVPGRWLLHGPMSTPGAAVRWLRDEVCAEEREEAVTRGESAYDAMSRKVLTSPPGAGGVICLPYMMGERSPIWDPKARAAFFGISLATTRGDLIRAVFEGTAFGLRQIVEIAEDRLGRPVSKLVAVGGGARNGVWNQIKADILQKPIQTMNISETATLGAALLGGLASGVYPDYAAAVKAVTRQPGATFFPDSSLAALYDAQYKVYCNLYPALRDQYEALAALREIYAGPGPLQR